MALVDSGLYDVVKVIEVVAGALIIANRFTPLMLAAAKSTAPSCATMLPPISTASSAVTVVCPSTPVPPLIVNPALVNETCVPGSLTLHCAASIAPCCAG